MIGGKIQPDERAWNAGLRELLEETQLQPVRFWTLPSVNAFYEWTDDRLNLAPAFAAEMNANPILNDEHVDYVWSDVESACDLLVWPEQQRLIRLTSRLLMHPLAPDWLIPTANPSRI